MDRCVERVRHDLATKQQTCTITFFKFLLQVFSLSQGMVIWFLGNWFLMIFKQLFRFLITSVNLFQNDSSRDLKRASKHGRLRVAQLREPRICNKMTLCLNKILT